MSSIEDKLFVAGPRDLAERPESFGFETVRPRRKYMPHKFHHYNINPEFETVYKSKKPFVTENLGDFGELLVAGMFSGQLLDINKHNEDTYEGGPRIQFSPDVLAPSIHDSSYNDLIEIKSSNRRRRGVKLSHRQIESYAYKSLNQISKGNLLSQTKYAFLRYHLGTTGGVMQYSSEDLVHKLGESYVDLVILPFNLLLYSLAYIPGEWDDTAESQQNRSVNSLTIDQQSALANGQMNLADVDLSKLGKNYPRDFIHERFGKPDKNDFMLNDIATHQFMYPENISISYLHGNETTPVRIPIQPFKVTEYHLNDPAKWNHHFIRNHPELLAAVGLENFYAKANDISVPDLLKFDSDGNPDWSVEPNQATGTTDIDPTNYF